mmetsp:Transcript_35601/g.54746  ORF Transcript_35601/g.54746 Transcript_35601/m.54746 type:complete len:144 (+) Transcript_35601:114-545(+)
MSVTKLNVNVHTCVWRGYIYCTGVVASKQATCVCVCFVWLFVVVVYFFHVLFLAKAKVKFPGAAAGAPSFESSALLLSEKLKENFGADECPVAAVAKLNEMGAAGIGAALAGTALLDALGAGVAVAVAVAGLSGLNANLDMLL